MTTDTDALLATVREGLMLARPVGSGRAFAALDSLAVELERRDGRIAQLESAFDNYAALNQIAEAELERVKEENSRLSSEHWKDAERTAMDQEIQRVKAERDEYVEQWANVCSIEFLDYWQTIGRSCSAGEAIQDLLAARDRALSALRVYATPTHWAIGRDDLRDRQAVWIGPGAIGDLSGLPNPMDTARTAIAEIEGEASDGSE